MNTLYKDCVVSHSASLEDKQRILVEGVDIPWFYGIINTFSLSLVCPKAFFGANFYISVILFCRKSIQS